MAQLPAADEFNGNCRDQHHRQGAKGDHQHDAPTVMAHQPTVIEQAHQCRDKEQQHFRHQHASAQLQGCGLNQATGEHQQQQAQADDPAWDRPGQPQSHLASQQVNRQQYQQLNQQPAHIFEGETFSRHGFLAGPHVKEPPGIPKANC